MTTATRKHASLGELIQITGFSPAEDKRAYISFGKSAPPALW